MTDCARDQDGIGGKLSPYPAHGEPAWWETRRFAAFLIVLSVVPLLLPAIPPLVDVPGHIGRLHLTLGGSPFLRQFFSPGSWPIGNLGVDVFVLAVGQFVGAELATRVIVTLVPPAMVASMLWVAREAHGKLPPTAAFAVPLAYSHPFLFGFVNFSLGLAVAFATFAIWLRLGNQGRLRTRALVMVPLGLITFVAHVSAWGVLGLMAFAAEGARRRDRGEAWSAVVKASVLQCLSLALPLIVLLLWRSGSSGETGGWFDAAHKLSGIISILRDRWMAIDLISLSFLLTLLIYGWRSRELAWSRLLAWPAIAVLIAYLALPALLFGSYHADMRIAPAVFILAVLSLNFLPTVDRRQAGQLAIIAFGFAILRLGVVWFSLHLAADRHRQLLAALDHVPLRSRVVVLVDHRSSGWPLQRNDHIGSMAIVRRDSFSNDQWDLEGGTSVRIHYPAAGRFMSDDSQLVAPHGNVRSIERSLADLPNAAFDALWIVDSTARPDPPGWTRVYRAPGNDLYLRAGHAGRRATQP